MRGKTCSLPPFPRPLKVIRRKALQRINQAEGGNTRRVSFQGDTLRKGAGLAQLNDDAARGDDDEAAHSGLGGAQECQQLAAHMARQARRHASAEASHDEQLCDESHKLLRVALDHHCPVHHRPSGSTHGRHDGTGFGGVDKYFSGK
jgi:hypothetical protein